MLDLKNNRNQKRDACGSRWGSGLTAKQKVEAFKKFEKSKKKDDKFGKRKRFKSN